jgi:hypothetical protein
MTAGVAYRSRLPEVQRCRPGKAVEVSIDPLVVEELNLL